VLKIYKPVGWAIITRPGRVWSGAKSSEIPFASDPNPWVRV